MATNENPSIHRLLSTLGRLRDELALNGIEVGADGRCDDERREHQQRCEAAHHAPCSATSLSSISTARRWASRRSRRSQ